VRPFGSAACARSGAAASSRFDGCGVPSFGGLEKRGFRGLSHSYALRGTAIMPTTPCAGSARRARPFGRKRSFYGSVGGDTGQETARPDRDRAR
jgi:hypothetical protein